MLRPALQRAVTCAGGSCIGGGGGERLLLLQSPVGYTATQVDQGRMLTITEGAIAPGPPTHAPMESSYRTHASERVAKARLQKGLGKARRRATAYQLRLCFLVEGRVFPCNPNDLQGRNKKYKSTAYAVIQSILQECLHRPLKRLSTKESKECPVRIRGDKNKQQNTKEMGDSEISHPNALKKHGGRR